MCTQGSLRNAGFSSLKHIDMAETQSPKDVLMGLIRERSTTKQDVYAATRETFALMKEVLNEVVDEIKEDFGDTDPRVEFAFIDRGEFEAEIKIAGDVLFFYMHTNVFQFDRSHSVWKSSYLQDNELNGYVGVVNVYNFLADSLKYQRLHDRGYLIARLFVNREKRFLVQGKRQMSYLFNDFLNAEMTRERMREFVLSSIIYTLGFDLLAPPYQEVQEVSVAEIEAMSQHLKVITGKRLGFKFSFDEEG